MMVVEIMDIRACLQLLSDVVLDIKRTDYASQTNDSMSFAGDS